MPSRLAAREAQLTTLSIQEEGAPARTKNGPSQNAQIPSHCGRERGPRKQKEGSSGGGGISQKGESQNKGASLGQRVGLLAELRPTWTLCS